MIFSQLFGFLDMNIYTLDRMHRSGQNDISSLILSHERFFRKSTLLPLNRVMVQVSAKSKHIISSFTQATDSVKRELCGIS